MDLPTPSLRHIKRKRRNPKRSIDRIEGKDKIPHVRLGWRLEARER